MKRAQYYATVWKDFIYTLTNYNYIMSGLSTSVYGMEEVYL